MAKTSVVVTLNGSNNNERKFVAELVQYLNARNIEVVADDLSLPENRIIHELLNHRWLVLILTPETARLRHIQAVVNAALEYVEEGHLQGVLALSYGNAPIEPEEMPYPWWSTIRTYHAGESDEDHRRAFEKVHRTVSYARVPALVGASSTANSTTPQNALYDTRNSRPSTIQPQPPLKRRVSLRVLTITFVVLLSVLSGMLIDSNLFHRSPAKSALVTVTPKSRHPTVAPSKPTLTPKATRTAEANASATAQATLTAVANATAVATANDLYKQVTESTSILQDPMNMQDTKSDWDQKSSCVFSNKDGMYHVINTVVGQYTPCMAKKTDFKDFAYQVEMTIDSGDEGGLIFGSDVAINTFYRFSLASTGYYALFAYQPSSNSKTDESEQLVSGNVPNVKQLTMSRKPIKLAVIANDTHIYLYVEDMFVNQVNDLPITDSGEIGLYAASVGLFTQSTNVAFKDVQVWDIQTSG